MIRLDAMWLAAEPIDMRAGAERLLARVVQVFGAAQAHHGYLFANARGTRVKLLVHDGFGVWCAARRLNAGRFVWLGPTNATPSLSLTHEQHPLVVRHRNAMHQTCLLLTRGPRDLDLKRSPAGIERDARQIELLS